MQKTKTELQDELVQLETRVREVRKMKRVAMGDYKDQLGDIEDQIEGVLKDLLELDPPVEAKG